MQGEQAPPNGGPPTPDTKQLDAVLAELERVNDLLEAAAETTSKVMQFIAVAFAAGVVAALQEPGLFISVPIFWSAWLLYAQTLDRTTVKRRAYAKHLEATANELLQRELLFWHGRLTSRAMQHKPFIFALQAAYWGALNVAAWVAGVVLLARSSAFYAAVAAVLGTSIWALTLLNIMRTRRFQELVDQQVKAVAEGDVPS